MTSEASKSGRISPPNHGNLAHIPAFPLSLLTSMFSKQRIVTGLLRLAIRPATKNHLLSTYSRSQKWLRPSDELKYYTDLEYRSRKIERGMILTARRRQDPEFREKEAQETESTMRSANNRNPFCSGQDFSSGVAIMIGSVIS